jgi:ribosomal protein S18 acetylase RimI-like enzyme
MAEVRLRRSREEDLAYVTTLERDADNRSFIGQWSDDEHRAAIAGKGLREHWIIERDGERAGYLIAYDCRGAGAGFYVKRILVAQKERGTGRAALVAFDERVFALEGVACVWLIVRGWNARAQAVYRSLGFTRFDPAPEEARRYDAAAERPGEDSFRMRLGRTAA